MSSLEDSAAPLRAGLPRSHSRGRGVALWGALFLGGSVAQAQSLPNMPDAGICGPLTNAFGPWEYRADHFVPLPGDQMSHAGKLALVEGAHFTPEVQSLVRGHSASIGGDLDYTLRAFPNNARALLAMMRYGERLKAAQVPGARYSVECYFVRATVFKPDDVVVRMLFATFLDKQNRRSEALTQLAAAREWAGDDPLAHYNLGLLYFQFGDADKALDEAHKALALGLPRTELKDKLAAAGKWVEPAASAPR